MLSYKGYDIPDTREEILKLDTEINKEFGENLANIRYKAGDQCVYTGINPMLLIHSFNCSSIVEEYIRIAKKHIDSL